MFNPSVTILIFNPLVKFSSFVPLISKSFLINASEAALTFWSTSVRCATSSSVIASIFVLGVNSKFIAGCSKGKPILLRSSRVSNCAGNVIGESNVSDGLLLNAPSPISITLFGMFNDVNALFAKAFCPILVIESEKITLTKDLPLKAELPMFSKPSKSAATKAVFPSHLPPVAKKLLVTSVVNTLSSITSSPELQDTITRGNAAAVDKPNPNNTLFVLIMCTNPYI